MIKSSLIDQAYFTNKKDSWANNGATYSIDNKKYKVIRMSQPHGNKVKKVVSYKTMYKSDGLFTNKSGNLLTIKSADCVPILISSKNGIGAIHAGWRGLRAKILENYFSLYESKSTSSSLAIGPHARVCCYQVSKEFEKFFHGYVVTKHGRHFLDMTKYIEDFCENNKIIYEDLGICTICDKEYFSFRGGDNEKRQYSYICL